MKFTLQEMKLMDQQQRAMAIEREVMEHEMSLNKKANTIKEKLSEIQDRKSSIKITSKIDEKKEEILVRREELEEEYDTQLKNIEQVSEKRIENYNAQIEKKISIIEKTIAALQDQINSLRGDYDTFKNKEEDRCFTALENKRTEKRLNINKLDNKSSLLDSKADKIVENYKFPYSIKKLERKLDEDIESYKDEYKYLKQKYPNRTISAPEDYRNHYIFKKESEETSEEKRDQAKVPEKNKNQYPLFNSNEKQKGGHDFEKFFEKSSETFSNQSQPTPEQIKFSLQYDLHQKRMQEEELATIKKSVVSEDWGETDEEFKRRLQREEEEDKKALKELLEFQQSDREVP